MGDVFSAVPEAMAAFSAANQAAGTAIIEAGTADSQAMLAAAAAALGPIGATYLAAHAPAQANCLSATLLVGQVHHALGCGTTAAQTAVVAADDV